MSYNDELLKGKRLFSSSKYIDALNCFNNVVQKHPDSKEAHLLEAMCYQNIEYTKSLHALSELYKILALDPEDSVVQNYIELVSSGKSLSEIIELYPVCYEISTDNRFFLEENEFVVNFIDDVTMKFKIIDNNKVEVVFCIYDKKKLGSSIALNKDNVKNVIIPSSINYNSKTFVITELGKGSFQGLDGDSLPLLLTNVEIPDTITKIHEDAFNNCIFLKSVKIPKSVIEIETGAFSYCMNLEQIEVEEGNHIYDSRENCNAIIESKTNKIVVGCKKTTIPSTVTTIGFAAFHGQRAMKSFQITNTINTIEQSAFLDTGLNRILFPDSLVSIEKMAFSHTPLKSVSFGNSIATIGDLAFSNNPILKTIVIPKSVKKIGKMAFGSTLWGNGIQSIKVHKNNPFYDSRNDCNAIIETNTNTLIIGCRNTSFPPSIKHIGENAFDECDSLFEITLPDSVETIGDGAFYRCQNLSKISLPESLTRIGAAAFSGCEKLTNLVIPKYVTYIGEHFLGGCDILESITCKNIRPPYLQSDVLFKTYEWDAYNKVILRVPMSSINNYKSAPGWKLFKNIVPIEESVE